MAIQKQMLRSADVRGRMDKVQALTGASTATEVTNYGVTSIASTAGGTAGNHGFSMAAPRAGLRKTLVVDVGSTRTVSVGLGPTTSVGHVFGTTNRTATFSTGAGRYRFLDLVGLSTSQWAVVGSSTGVTLSA